MITRKIASPHSALARALLALALLALALLALVATTGCRALGFAPPVCDSTGDCPFGLACNADGLCVEDDVNATDGGEVVDGGAVPRDGGDAGSLPPSDSGLDAGLDDAGKVDAGDGDEDSGLRDAGVDDAGRIDGGDLDAGLPNDAGVVDAGVVDAGAPIDAGGPSPDAGLNDYLAAWPMTSSGEERTGTYPGVYGGDVFFAPGVDGEAAYFRGPGAFMQVGTTLSAMLSNQPQASFTAWIRDDESFGRHVLAAAGNPDLFPDFATGNYDGVMYLDVGVDFDQYVEVVDYDEVAPSGRWYHWAVVFDGTRPQEERAKIYIDGVLLENGGTSQMMPQLIGDLDARPFTISYPASNNWRGFVDDARIYRRALTTSEVDELASMFAPPIPQDYRFFTPFEYTLDDVTVPDGSPLEVGAFDSDEGVVGNNLRLEGADSFVLYDPLTWIDGTQAALTASLWFSFNSDIPRERQFFALYANNGRQIVLGVDAGDSFFFDVSDATGNVVFLDGFSSFVSSGDWHHLVVTLDGTQPPQQRVQIQLDGTALPLETSGQIPDSLPNLSSIPLLIGASDSVFDGALDELMVFDRALSESERQMLYAAGLAALSN